MASHHQPVTVRPRSLANILDDLRHARREYDDALAGICSECRGDGVLSSGFYFRSDHSVAEDCAGCPCCEGTGKPADAEDRASEAETRMEDLRSEFADALTEATGLTFEALMKAREGCLL
jgi:hypothetical protein